MDNHTALELLCEILSFNRSPDAICLKISQLSHEDWEILFKVATKQKATLILYEYIRKYDNQVKIPDFAKARLRETYHRSLAKNLRMLHHAKLVLEALSNQHIEVIALKGIYLAEAIYTNVGLRTFFDLDFMVRKEDISRTLSFMKDIGYITSTYYNPEDNNPDIKHIPAMLKGDSPYIEIHWGILEEDEPFNIDVKGIWQRASKVKLSGVDSLALGYEDLILHLCVHFSYQHNMEIGLGSLYDIALVIQNHRQQIDWDKLIYISECWEIEKIIWLTFCVLNRVLNVAIPDSALDRLLPGNNDQKIVDLAINHFLEKANSEKNINITPDLVNLSSRKGVFGKIKLILNRIFIPRHILARAYNKSPNSITIYFYYFVRLRDLFFNYSPTILKISQNNKDALASVKSEVFKEQLIDWYTNDVQYSIGPK